MAFPADKIFAPLLLATPIQPSVEDFFNFPFKLIVNNDRRRRFGLSSFNPVLEVRFKEGNVKNVMNPQVLR
jgi:hypothetical protein